jgi:tetratricopeptide (TPR) repeat protein
MNITRFCRQSRLIRVFAPILLLASATVLAEPDGADPLSEVTTLARTGAAELAVSLMDRHQPSAQDDPAEWTRWERERIFLYRSRGRWQQVADRLESLPETTGRGFHRWAMAQRARALIELGRPDEARTVLAGLIWSIGPASADQLQDWRHMVVETYLEEGRAEDARNALRRYRQDHPDAGDETRLVEARLYLLEGRGAAAEEVLRRVDADQHRVLRLAAYMETDSNRAGEVLERAIRLGHDRNAPIADRRAAWALAADAARILGNLAVRTAALERGIALAEGGTDPIFRLEADALWRAYLELGESLGNEARLLVGDDGTWFELAETHLGGEPVLARALLAVVAVHSFDDEARDRGHDQIAASLYAERHGPAVLERLYLDSNRFGDPAAVPRPVRYRLADLALQVPDIPLASSLMEGLESPPEGTDPVDWQLRRARVLLLGGAREEGLAALATVLQPEAAVTLQIDRFLQVVFDLQSMNDHAPALGFLGRLLDRELEPGQRREILFWKAESHEGVGDHVEAARFYLRSAGLFDPFSMDPWAQTARYRAADVLAEAGLAADARRLYEGLLNATDDEARRAVLRNRLQRLDIRPEAEIGRR